ncbi:Ig-like domain-containing protein [Persicirhabdus sediminis]|uniref:Tandem-95 repeat protein n=1 Tax=Persicirhabdus sediminis TaxID=454144 RepID=A0A8J7SHX3_9BACT|nr:Ig-like domain-containing protein [Persicirhabdus sediminis]MBK1790139.1 tandem-95 repeat protein [Persicirhabdus sediminis]
MSKVQNYLKSSYLVSLLIIISFIKCWAVVYPDDDFLLARERERLAALALVNPDYATHVSIKSGSWSDTATWSNGAIPSHGARVVISDGQKVTIDGVIAEAAMTIRVDGTLYFTPEANTALNFDTMVVSESGLLQVGTTENPVTEDFTATITIEDLNGGFDSNPVSPDYDFYQLGQGIVVLGRIEMHGAAKDGYAAIEAIPVGVTQLKFPTAPAGWQVGDLIAMPGYTGSNTGDELRQISAISSNGRNITFQAVSQPDAIVAGRTFSSTAATIEPREIITIADLQEIDPSIDSWESFTEISKWNHFPRQAWRRDEDNQLIPLTNQEKQAHSVKAMLHVLNLSRNVSIVSRFDQRNQTVTQYIDPDGLNTEVIENTGRGHVMLLHNNRGDIRNVAFNGLGRTNLDQPTRNPLYDDEGTMTRQAYNPLGRSAFTAFYAQSVSGPSDPARVYGCTFTDSLAIGALNYGSSMRVEDCAAYSCQYAGFGAYQQDCVGTFVNNAALCGETGFTIEAHYLRVEDNIVSGFSGTAYNFSCPGGNENAFSYSRPTYFDIEVDNDPENMNPLLDNGELLSRSSIVTRNNTAYGGNQVLRGNYYQGATHINMFGHGVLNGFARWYSYNTICINPILIHNKSTKFGQGYGIGSHNNSGRCSFINPTIFGFKFGVHASASGHEEVIGGRLANIIQILTNTRPMGAQTTKLFQDITFLDLDPEVEPDERRADISLTRANHFNGGADGKTDIIELKRNGSSYRLYPARETHPDYIPHLVTDIPQAEPQSVRYFGYSNEEIYTSSEFQYDADDVERLGTPAYWFANCRPPFEESDRLVFPTGYSPDDTLDQTERPTYAKHTWADYWVEGKIAGLELQNVTIDKGHTSILRPRVIRVNNITVNDGAPLTIDDLVFDEETGTYYYEIDCSVAFYDPNEDDGILRSEYSVTYNSFIESSDGTAVVSDASFMEEGILRLTINTETSGLHYLTVQGMKANGYGVTINEDILINFQGSTYTGPLLAVDDGPISANDQEATLIPISSLLANDNEAITAAREELEAQGNTLTPQLGFRLAGVDTTSQYGASLALVENPNRNLLTGELNFDGYQLDTTLDAQEYMLSLINGDVDDYAQTLKGGDSSFMRIEFPEDLVEEINFYSNNNNFFYNVSMTLEHNGEVVYEQIFHTPEMGTRQPGGWTNIILPPGITADAWQLTLLYNSNYDAVANGSGNCRIRLCELELLGPKYEYISYTPGNEHYAIGDGDSILDAFNYTIEDYAYIGEYVKNSKTDIIPGAWRTASAEVSVNVSGSNKPPLALDDQVKSGDITSSEWYAYQLLGNDISSSNGSLAIHSIDATSAMGVPIKWNASTGTITYKPDGYFSIAEGEEAWDSFSYTPIDSNGIAAQEPATVNVRILGEFKESVAHDDTFATFSMSPLFISTSELFANDENKAMGELSLISWSAISNQGVSINYNEETETLEYYTPAVYGSMATGDTASDSFNYTIEDSNGIVSSAKVSITITGNYASPIANNDLHGNLDTLIVAADYPHHPILLSTLLANDITPDPNPTFSCDSSTSAGGTIKYTAGNDVLYYDPTPILQQADFIATGACIDTFTYQITDSQGGSDTATVKIQVLAKTNTGFSRKIKFGTAMPRYLVPVYSGNKSDPIDPIYLDSDWVFANMDPVSEQADGSIFGWRSSDNSNLYTGRSVKCYFPNMMDFYTAKNIYEMEWSYAVLGTDDVWEIAVPKGTYEVYMTLGAADSRLTDDSIKVEGKTYFSESEPDYNREVTVVKTIDVSDGFLSIYSMNESTPVIVALEIKQVDYPEEGLLGAAPDTYDANQGETLFVAAPGLLANDAFPEGSVSAIVYGAANKSTARGDLSVNADGSFSYTPPSVALGTETFSYKVEVTDADGNTRRSNLTTVTFNLRGSVGMNVIYQNSDLAGKANSEGLSWIDDNGISNSNLTEMQHGMNYGWSSNLGKVNSRLSDEDTVGPLYAAGAVLGENNRSWYMYDLAPGIYEVSCLMGSTTEEPNSKGYDSYPQNNGLCINGIQIYDATTATEPSLDNLERITTIVELTAANTTIHIEAGEESNYPVLAGLTIRSVIAGAPEPIDQYVTLEEDHSVEVTLSATNIDSDTISYEIVDLPTNGTISINGNMVSYTPDPDFNGMDQFSYKARNGDTSSLKLGYIQLEVIAVNDAPIAYDNSVTAYRNSSVNIELTASDVDGDELTYHIIDSAKHGTVSVEGKLVTYTVTPGYHGIDSFTFVANDGEIDSQTAMVDIFVSSTMSPQITDIITVGSESPTDPGTTTGTYVIRERKTDLDPEMHISAFVNFDVSSIGDFDPARGDTAEVSFVLDGTLNTNNNAALYLARVTGGEWNSSNKLPKYAWATRSNEPLGPGTQEDEIQIASNVLDYEIGETLSVDITHLIDAWINGDIENYGFAIYLANSNQGAGFSNLNVFINKQDEGSGESGYTAWINNYTDLTSDNQSLLADPDNDGMNNLLEYALGGDPADSSNQPFPVYNDGELSFNYYAERNDIAYIVQKSANLLDWHNIATLQGDNYASELSDDYSLFSDSGSPEKISISPKSQSNEAKVFLRLKVIVTE